jgi:hypothetical protein
VKSKTAHPALHLLAYLFVPLAINTLALVHSDKVFPTGGTLVLGGGTTLVAISWGWGGLFFCAFLGACFGLPIAGLQAAYLHSRLARVSRGQDVRQALALDPWLGGPWPWLVAATVAMAVGWVWVFPPIGGPLLAVNVLWARTLLYHHEVRVYELLRADAEARGAESPEQPALVRVPYGA